MSIPTCLHCKNKHMAPIFKDRMADMATELRDFAADVGDWAQASARRMGGVEQRRLAARFATWALADGQIRDEPLRAWIGGLDALGREALGEHVAAFCADFDVDLAWLVDGALADDWPALEAGLRDLVTHYCNACKAAVSVDEDLVRYRRRAQWQHKVARKEGEDSG
jgi:hypothetical protein